MKWSLVSLVILLATAVICLASYGLTFIMPEMGTRVLIMFLFGLSFSVPIVLVLDRIING